MVCQQELQHAEHRSFDTDDGRQHLKDHICTFKRRNVSGSSQTDKQHSVTATDFGFKSDMNKIREVKS